MYMYIYIYVRVCIIRLVSITMKFSNTFHEVQQQTFASGKKRNKNCPHNRVFHYCIYYKGTLQGKKCFRTVEKYILKRNKN